MEHPSTTDMRSLRSSAILLGSTVALCGAGFLLIALGHEIFYREFSVDFYLVFHTSAEFFSIVVSFAIFTIGWYGYKQKSDPRNLALALTFYAVGLLDFVHAFSFKGMPDFLGANSVGKAATYFVAARLVAAVGLLSLAFIPARRPPRWMNPYLLLAAVSAIVLGFVMLETYATDALPAMFIEGEGLTPFKNFMEYLVIAIELITIVALQTRQVFGPRSTSLLQVALVVGIFSELSFTVYASAYDSYNFIGHVYKIIAYYLVLRAIFVSALQQPYSDLEKTQEDLENSFGSIGAALASSLELDKALSLISVLSSDLLKSPHALVALKKENEQSLVVLAWRGLEHPPQEIPLVDNLAGFVWVNRRPYWIRDVNEPAERVRSVVAGPEGLRSAVAVPIMKDDDVLGEIAVYSKRIAAFGEAEARLLAAFARQAAVAIENARLYESELDSRGRVQSYAAQLAILHKISLQLNRETETGRLLEMVLEGAMQLTSAGLGLMTLIRDGKTEVISMQRADWFRLDCEIEGDLEHLHKRIARMIGGRGRESMRIRESETAQRLSLPEGHLPLRGLMVGTIRDTRGEVNGHFMLSDKAGGAGFTEQDEEIISLLAAESSVALISAENFEREHSVAESLQAALLPSVPERDDIEVGLLYQAAGPYGRVGGDFYDFIELDDNKIAVVVGDVCGKGLEAATYTAMIKYMLRAYLGEGMLPGQCLTRLNANIGREIPPDRFVTVCLALIDTEKGLIDYSSAGHPPPIVCRAHRANVLHTPGSIPIGVLEDQVYESSRVLLLDVCQVILYSDGLIEARPEDGTPFGEERAATAVTDTCQRPAQQVADDLVAQALGYAGGQLRDDIALLVVRFLGISAI